MRRFGRPGVRLEPWGIVGISAALLLLAAGCPDALTLEPIGAGGGSSSSSGSGNTGGSAGAGTGGSTQDCVSNSDCAAPAAVCDTAKGSCVECLVISDCTFRPGTVCSEGQCACPTAGQSYCENPSRCVDLQTSSQDCGSCGHACFGACSAGKCADAWEPTPTKGAPSARKQHVAVWAGGKMFVWSGNTGAENTNTGGLLDLATNTWTPTSTSNVPGPRKGARAVWTGTHVVVWGGSNGPGDTPLNTGAIFNPMTNTWSAMTTSGAPSPRYGHTMVWAGSKVLVWGGTDGPNYFGDGNAYDVNTDSWTPIPAGGTPPSARAEHSAVWTGSLMIVFGGYGFDPAVGTNTYLGDGAELDPVTGTWTNVKDGQPSARSRHSGEWAGQELIIWGGRDQLGLSPSGARYKPTIEWTLMTTDGAPELREFHTALWMAPRFIVWGGLNAAGSYINSGAVYDPTNNSWSSKPIPTSPAGRAFHTAVDAGGKMIVWGGQTAEGLTNTGGVLNPNMLP